MVGSLDGFAKHRVTDRWWVKGKRNQPSMFSL
jgi:hypothetical protein